MCACRISTVFFFLSSILTFIYNGPTKFAICARFQFAARKIQGTRLRNRGCHRRLYFVRLLDSSARLAAMSTVSDNNKSSNTARINRLLLFGCCHLLWLLDLVEDQTSWCLDWSADVWICNGYVGYRCVCTWLGTVDTQTCPGSARDSDFLCESLFFHTICTCAGCSHLATCQTLAAYARLLNLQNQNINFNSNCPISVVIK